MLKILVRALLGLVALILVIIGGAAGYVWYLGDEAVNRAAAAGWFSPPPSDAPMTVFESTVQKVFFSEPGRSRYPIAYDLATKINSEEYSELSLRSNLRRVSLSWQLQNRFSDTQLLRLFLPHTRFSKTFSGPEPAAQAVFGKSVAELDPEESVRLAALFESLNIHTKPEKWDRRVQFVREKIAETGP